VARSRFPSQKCKKLTGTFGALLKVQMGFAWQAQGTLHLAKSEGFCSISKNDGRGETFEEDLE